MRRGIVIISVAILMITCVVIISKLNTPKELTAYQKWAKEKIERKKKGEVKADAPEMMGVIARELRTKLGESEPKYRPNHIMEEFLKAKSRLANRRTDETLNDELNFIERGPGNVAGRTRGLIIDPDDASGQTWYAGSASGGIWKTADGGANWDYISEDIPNLGTNTLAMAPSNTQVIYAGTGEHFTNDVDGAGLFKSTDKGNSWTQVASPSDFNDFKNVSRIIVNPDDENEVVVTSRNSLWEGRLEAAIYKTTDGGTTWSRTRSSTMQRYDDIDYDPSDFNTMYVAVQGFGVIKSTDGGESWFDSNTGMSPSGRVEITVSPVNSNRLWASVQGNVSGTGSDLYVSSDGSETWEIATKGDGNNEDFLGGQGWYDNIITAHPFDEDIVYVGGVNVFKFELTGTTTTTNSIQTSLGGTDAFMSYVNFGGEFLSGGLSIEAPQEELRSIEIRFGEGTQKAHRFTVDGRGSGVPDSDYEYEDYVDIPFQVWDIENNIQLMAAFRDQQDDGEWNLIEANTDGDTEDHSREYLFIYNIEYDESADETIGQDGGVDEGRIYFFWPILTPGAMFDANALPTSTLSVTLTELTGQERETTVVSDAYNDFDGTNAFPQDTRTQGLHPDQHNIVIGDVDENNQTFRLYIGNDGGVYESVSSGDPGPNEGDFEYVSFGYNTTQFYGADKAPGEYRFIGGMQDNGTWYNAVGTEGSASSENTFGIGGDGFESLWHSFDVDKMIGGSQFNGFAKTINGGGVWVNATTGFDDNGPFITRLSHNKLTPDVLFTVGSQGVWKSTDFGSNWSSSSMVDNSQWVFTNSTDVEVSVSNPDIIWAGTFLANTGRPYVSTDGGETFNFVNNDGFNMGSSSGIATHPTEENTAFMLFSFADNPKVLKTDDLGQTWEDISGFDGSGDRGFPDVAINCLFVFPTNTDKIWVGSEIGIIESLDGGASWGLLKSNMPAVNIYDFKLVENTLTIATYGRGIWSVDIENFTPPAVTAVYTTPEGMLDFTFSLEEAFDEVEVYIEESLLGSFVPEGIGTTSVSFPNQGFNGVVGLRLIGFVSGATTSSSTEAFVIGTTNASDSYGSNFEDAEDDFVGNGFTITRSRDFNEAINSEHPYEENSTYYYYLKTPITVSSGNANFYYQDIALVNSTDFVTIEASNDGLNWIQLVTPYNATLHNDWESQLGMTAPASWIYKANTIDLSQSFDPGEDILIRFVLSSVEGSSAYGWLIDNVFIQENPILSASVVPTASVYPTIVAKGEMVNLRKEGGLESTISVFDIMGNRVGLIEESSLGNASWNTENVTSGIYFIRSSTDLLGKVIVK